MMIVSIKSEIRRVLWPSFVLFVVSLGLVFCVRKMDSWTLPIFLLLLSVLSVFDFHYFRLPDWGTKTGIALGLVFSILGYFHVPEVSLVSVRQSVLGAALGYGLIWLVACGYRLLAGHDGLGMGDAKFLSMIGAWLGFSAVGNALFLGSLSGSVLMLLLGKKKDFAVPFGPFLTLGTLIFLVFPQISIFP